LLLQSRYLRGATQFVTALAAWAHLPPALSPRRRSNAAATSSMPLCWGRIIDALAAAHDATVQMIDTSIVRVHQHAACITKNQRQSIGRSRGGLASKIHALVDSNGLPVRLTLSPGEAHDVRLAGKLLSRSKSASMLLADRGYDADWIRELAMEKRRMGEHPAEEQSQRSNLLEPLSLPRPQQGGTVPQQDQTMSSRRDTLRQACSQLPQLASIRLWLRVNESAS